MPALQIIPSNNSFDFNEGETLLTVLLRNGIFINNPCNGLGTCGKCLVKICKNETDYTETEKQKLSVQQRSEHIHLACCYKPQDGAVVLLLTDEGSAKVLTEGTIPKFSYMPTLDKTAVNIVKPALSCQLSFEEQILTKAKATEIDFNLLNKCSYQETLFSVTKYGDTVIDIEIGDTTDKLYGVAIDIGTTTVVCQLVDIKSGKLLSSASRLNAQKNYGLDVLTRITYEMYDGAEAVQNLQHAIVSSINEMIDEILDKESVDRRNVCEVDVAANNTMLHTLLGVDASSIGKAPYSPIFTASKLLRASDIGIEVNTNARLYLLPSVSAYIGADIVAGAYVCELAGKRNNTMFIDIGTNGEIVLSHKGKLLCCSCAAGPALEGMNISCGMRAENGAIEELKITENGIELKTIGGDKCRGLCGSGIISALKELIRTGIVTRSGAFIRPEKLEDNDYRRKYIRMHGSKREFVLCGDSDCCLQITQDDVRQVQLAKGAILSGFLALLQKTGILIEELDEIIVAGQFGAHLSAENLIGIGILPKAVQNKVTYIGNSSKTGAYMALMSSEVKSSMERVALQMEYTELGAIEGYEKLFSESMIFPES